MNIKTDSWHCKLTEYFYYYKIHGFRPINVYEYIFWFCVSCLSVALLVFGCFILIAGIADAFAWLVTAATIAGGRKVEPSAMGLFGMTFLIAGAILFAVCLPELTRDAFKRISKGVTPVNFI